MAAVYSTRLLLGEATAADSLTFTVPATQVCIVTNLDGLLNQPGSAFANMAIQDVYFWGSEGTVAAGSLYAVKYSGRQVLNPGDVLTVGCTTQLYVCVSGYLLNAP